MTMALLKQKRDELDAKRKQMHAIFDEAGPDLDLSKVTSIEGNTQEKAAEIRLRNDEMTEIAQEIEGLVEVTKAHDQMTALEADLKRPMPIPLPGEAKGGAPVRKSAGEQYANSVAFKGIQGNQSPEATLDIELKTLFQTTAGWAPEVDLGPRLVLSAQRPVQVLDLLPQTTTQQTAVTYMEETTFTNAAAETGEGGTYAEAALALTKQTAGVKKIAVYLPMTDEQLEDEARAIGYVNNRLPFMIRQRLDGQVVNGDGLGDNLTGILQTVGIGSQPRGTDADADAIYKGIVLSRVTGRAFPDAVLYHPTNWQTIRLLKTTDGIYIWGSPAEAGPARIWGLPVVETDAVPVGTALVGDFANFSELSTRRGITVQTTNSHSDDFINGKLAMRADMRAALVVYRPAAFVEVTALQ